MSDGESPRLANNAEVELVMKPQYPTSIRNTLVIHPFLIHYSPRSSYFSNFRWCTQSKFSSKGTVNSIKDFFVNLTVYSLKFTWRKAWSLKILWGRGKKWSCISIYSKGTELAAFADPFNSTIYRQSSITNQTANTKIPHLLCGKTYLKPRMEWMILFTIYGLFRKMWYDGDGRKTPKYTKDEIKEKIPRLVALPSPVYEVEADCFPVSENTENKPDLPLVGEGS